MKTTLSSLVLILSTTLSAIAADPAPPRVEFTRLIAHWDAYGENDYLKFVEDARPEICQIGFYGGHLYSLSHTSQYAGYPAHFPVRGIEENHRWLAARNKAIHDRGAKVIGHFNVSFLVGEPGGADGPQGFFKFYKEQWDTKLLGPKPVADPLDLMARNADGSPMASKTYSIGNMREFTACLNNPHWRSVLKAWLKIGIAQGVDGFIANYFYRHNCLCSHCQAGFRDYLGERFSPDQLRDRFQINDLGKHAFPEIVGWHDPKQSTPLRREMLRYSQIATKKAFDDVFVKHGRSLKTDLIVAQWNHLGNFHQISGDERCLLPTEQWGTGEDYLWYSTGDAANSTDLAKGFLGEATLQARYIRGSFDDKPFTLGKYESTRIRVAIAELAANGGAPMGFYTRFKDPQAREEIVRYYRFLEKHDALFHGNRSHAEVVLTFPRTKVHAGNVAAVEQFKTVGTELLDKHVLFDVVPDDLWTVPRKVTVIDPANPLPKFERITQVTAPQTVRVSASRPAGKDDVTYHFVNYNRTEPKTLRSPGNGIIDEKPIAVENVQVDTLVPENRPVQSVVVMTPESPEPVAIPYEAKDGRLRFTVTKFLVYSVVAVKLGPAP